jgi:SAM-dependent methyltransferase
MANYRPQGHFVGVDGSASAIATAVAHVSELGLTNLELVHADFATAAPLVTGVFEFILAHGVFSWIPGVARDNLLALCARHLAPGGLVYLNYNALPGWNIRGMVRRFLLKYTAQIEGLGARAHRARELAVKVASALAAAPEHPYARLLEREFQFVVEGHPSYIAHEFLAKENHAYWRSEFLALVGAHRLTYVADADFNYPSGRIATDLGDRIAAELGGAAIEDTVDLLSYRQLHSPILTDAGWRPRPAHRAELSQLFMASPLVPAGLSSNGTGMFRHPTGFEVEAKQEPLARAFEKLAPIWPEGIGISELLGDEDYSEDLKLLHRHGLIELRLPELGGENPRSEPLNRCEARWTGHVTSRYHTIAPAMAVS